jgi:hypothetical protein
MTAWGVGSLVHTSPTSQTHRTAEIVVDRKQAVSAGISAGIIPLFWSPETPAIFQPIFNRWSLQQKIPFPAAGCRRPIPSDSGNWKSLGQKRRANWVCIIAD